MFRLEFPRSSLTDTYHVLDKKKPNPDAVAAVTKPKAAAVTVVTKPKADAAVTVPKAVAAVTVPKAAAVTVPKAAAKAANPKTKDTPPGKLRVIHNLLSGGDAEGVSPKPKRATEMSGLWKQAQVKGIKGYNRMKKAELLQALA